MGPLYVCHAPSTEWVLAVSVYRKGDWNFRSPGRPLLRPALEGLEPCDGNLSRTVLRGPGVGNNPRLPGIPFLSVLRVCHQN